MADTNDLTMKELLSKLKNVSSIEGLEEVIAKAVEAGIPEELFQISEADDLVEQAWEKPREEAIELCREALEIEPDNIAAFVLLGDLEENLSIRAALFKRGLDIGMEKFAGEFMDEHRGNFWTLEETRPYMLCLAGYAEALAMMGEYDFAMNIWHEMLELNPEDDQNVRYQAMATAAFVGDEEFFEKFDSLFQDDDGAAMHFNRALLEMNINGVGATADEHIRKGVAINPHIIPMLTSEEETEETTESSAPGSPGEAWDYAEYATELWHQIPGATEHLKGFVK